MLQLTPNNPFGLDYNTLWIETKDLIIKSLKQKDVSLFGKWIA